jgi:coatomer subunit gamma
VILAREQTRRGYSHFSVGSDPRPFILGKHSAPHSSVAPIRANFPAAAMAMMTDERALSKMKDDDVTVSPFDGIEKGAVLQECRIFNDRQLNTRRCEDVLVRLLYLVGQGQHLTSDEATGVFFSVTKLFQANEPSLRRLVYLAIKELAHTAEEVIIVTNCLTKDINSKVDMYRANATRVLCTITDSQMVQAIERYLKQEIVDRNPVVASAALVSGQQLILHNKGDVVRRWVNEVTQALEHPSPMVQYHALGLLYLIKQHDRLAVSKLVQSMTRLGMRSPMATVLLVRYVARIIAEEPSPPAGSNQPRPFFDFLEACLKHRSDVVIYEAARAIATLPDVSPGELQPAVSVLQRFLVQPKPAQRFAAIRTLNMIASSNPLAVTACNADMEVLIADPNRSIATIAITTLLRTGSEESIERLLKQIQSFMSDIADEFKVKVVDAIHALCIKYPSKHYALMNFLGNSLREEGGFEFKSAIVRTYLALMDKIPDAKESCLAHLCEFIEDCEHTQLSTEILHLLGKEGPSMPTPGKYIRYIYNRLILENATVRAAAVSALSRFAGSESTPELRRSVAILLKQSLMDSDDEVRDRATFFTHTLDLEVLNGGFVDQTVITDENAALLLLHLETDADGDRPVADANGAEVTISAETASPASAVPSEMIRAAEQLLTLPCPVSNLEAELLRYVGSESTEMPFDLDAVPKAAMLVEVSESATPVNGANGGKRGSLGQAGHANTGRTSSVASRAPVMVDPAAAVMAIPEFASMGRPFKTCEPMDLTEAETEYTAKAVIHLYASNVILEFICVNTLEDQLLENVVIQVETAEATGLGGMTLVPIARLAYGVPGRTFAAIERTDDGEYPMGSLSCVMKYMIKDVDTATGEVAEDGFADEYPLDQLDIAISHLMAKPAELPSSFKAAWEALGPENEAVENFALDAHDNTMSAAKAVMEFLGMAPCEGTENVSDRARTHVLLMTGVFYPGVQCMLHAKLSLTAEGVAVDLMLRSEDLSVSELVAGSILG